MKRYFRRGILPLMCLLLSSASVLWGDAGKISGYFFGDYYYVLKSHNAELEERNGFQYRRVYFDYDRDLSDAFSTRFRFEMNGAAFPTERKKIEPFLKNAYLRWKKPEWRTNIYLGLSSNPTWKNVERVWGYRSVAKTVLHMHKMGNGSDFGIALQGDVDKSKRINYHLIFANGTSTSAEIDGNKKIAFSLAARPVTGVIVEGYADFENAVDRSRWYTLQGLLGYQSDQFRVGVQLANQTREPEGKDNLNILASSVFGAAQLLEKKLWAFARFDRLFDPSPAPNNGYVHFDGTAAPNMIIAGLDWTPFEAFHIMPNLVFVFYDEPDNGAKPDATIMPRLTGFFRF
ncbi:hypothetical protein J4G02_13095 [Candidatus Poribacteria bacterium]|nr:hypothetical protein [Candidatus Poribacteria bacterium]